MDELIKELILKGFGRHRIVSDIYSMNNDENTKADIADAYDMVVLELARQQLGYYKKPTA